MVLLLHTGRCYEAEICVILFLFRCPFIWYPFWPKSKFSDFGRKPSTIVRHYDQYSFRTHNSSLEGATEPKFVPFCWTTIINAILKQLDLLHYPGTTTTLGHKLFCKTVRICPHLQLPSKLHTHLWKPLLTLHCAGAFFWYNVWLNLVSWALWDWYASYYSSKPIYHKVVIATSSYCVAVLTHCVWYV